MPKVRCERDGDVAVVTLADPPLNLFGRELLGDLHAALDEAAASDARALVVRAEGNVFTGGADVKMFQGLTGEQVREELNLIAIPHKLEAMPIPTLAVVHALCLTAGFELALGCDLIWAAESSQFGLVEAVVGVTPFMGGTQRVAERAGPARARELVMTGGLYPAARLLEWGVVNRVVPDGELEEKAMRFAARLAAGPTRAHAATKRMVRAFLEGGVPGADAAMNDVAAEVVETEDFKHGVRSFLEDGPGKATFAGR
ncbi:MAG: enoyl-CoA hydratase/isomerase family protein [Actinomycetota bacterium]|nr:enoyl-CoA hydratase/isomerase family protein [Actinomycetota bacterium]